MIENTTKLLGNLNGEKSYLICLEPETLQRDIHSIIDFLVNKRQWTCVYLSANRPYKNLKSFFERNGYNIKKFFFIDTVDQPPKEKIENVLFVPGPSALTQMHMAITQITQFTQNRGVLIIDSLDGLSIDNDPNTLAMFLRSVITKITKYESKAVVLTCGGVDEMFINKITPFFDKVIKLNKEVEK